jgi:hypothetical protein
MYNGTAIFNPAPAAKDYTNALINGDFENDFMGWAHVSSTPTIGTSVKHGNKAAVWNNVSANYTGIMKTTKIPTGHKVYVSYWYNIPAITSGGSFYCQVMNGAGTTLGYLQPSSAVTNGWVRMSGTFTLAAADVKLYFGTSNITGTIYLDAVMIIDLSAKFADVSTKNTDWCNANITVDNIEWTTPYVVASDSFDGENSTNSMGNTETGQTWLALDGSKWGTINNKAYRVSANTAGRKYDVAVIESGLSDCAVEWVNDGQRITRYAFRVLDAANLIFLYGETSSGTYAMNKQENDVGTAIASYPLVPAAGDIIRVELSGSNIVVKVNGTQIMNINNSFNQTQTKHGLLTGNAYSGARWDNFKVEAI